MVFVAQEDGERTGRAFHFVAVGEEAEIVVGVGEQLAEDVALGDVAELLPVGAAEDLREVRPLFRFLLRGFHFFLGFFHPCLCGLVIVQPLLQCACFLHGGHVLFLFFLDLQGQLPGRGAFRHAGVLCLVRFLLQQQALPFGVLAYPDFLLLRGAVAQCFGFVRAGLR